jgi:uncharacterized protein (DUF488 family)
MTAGEPTLWTVGHSNRPLDELIGMLRANGVELLVDIRSVPKSRYNPQFNRESLPGPLAQGGIRYAHMPGLGGLRHPRKDSINAGWRNASFRGYADYMQTPEFAASLDELLRLAAVERVAVMCAEAVPWRCHRSLVADAVSARGVAVRHILSATRSEPHQVTSFARIVGNLVSYPAPNLELFG